MPRMWWKLSSMITCGTLAGAMIPELVKVFTSVDSGHVKEVVTSSREGGASLNILSGLVAGNFSALLAGLTIMALMAIGLRRKHVRHGRPDEAPRRCSRSDWWRSDSWAWVR